MTLDIRIVGKFEEDVDCRRLEVVYSSSCAGMKTQASWKNGFLELVEVERRREWVGEGPVRSAKASVYWMTAIWSLEACTGLRGSVIVLVKERSTRLGSSTALFYSIDNL